VTSQEASTLGVLVRTRTLMIVDFLTHDGLSKLADNGQLIANVGVESLKPRQFDRRFALSAGDDVSAVDSHHSDSFPLRVQELRLRRTDQFASGDGS
jgi:hypothetical protein